MNYKEALEYLNSFIDYEKTGFTSLEPFKLDRMRYLAGAFGNPENSFRSIHVAGTKGKGSITSFIGSILKESGFSVGVYTSPHLSDPRERIKINGNFMMKSEFSFYVSQIKSKLGMLDLNFSPTFFEIYTLLAFNYFRDKKIDFGIIEVGLGGRLDATNIINSEISVISPISYDHMNILGEDLEKIAYEKSGIIKKESIVLSAPQEERALRVIEEKAASLGAKLILVGEDILFKELYHNKEKEVFSVYGPFEKYEHCKASLIGQHQVVNAACAVGVADILRDKGERVTEEAIKKGLKNAKNPARCEIVSRDPLMLLDGAQNKESAKALKKTIKRNFNRKNISLILGMSKDKDVEGLVDELSPLASKVFLTKAKIDRALEPKNIKKFINGKKVILTDSVEEALEKVTTFSQKKDLIVICGSFFVVGEARESILSKKYNEKENLTL